MNECRRCGEELRWRLAFYPSVVAIDPLIAPVLTCVLCPDVAAVRLDSEVSSRLIAEWQVGDPGGATLTRPEPS